MTKSKQTAVAVIDPQVTAIATMTEAGDIEGLKGAAAMATGLKEAAKKRGLGITAENKAAEVVIRAERGIGQVLIDMAAKGLRATHATSGSKRKTEWGPGGVRVPNPPEVLASQLPSPSDLGLTLNESSKYQLLARLSDEEFEGLIAEHREKDERIAKVDFYRLAKPEVQKVSEAARAVADLPVNSRADSRFARWQAETQSILGRAVADDDEATETWPERPFEHLHVDDLVVAADLIKRLVAAYQAEKAARAVGA